MKRTYLIFIFLSLVLSGFAQDREKAIYVGVVGGAGYYSTTFSPSVPGLKGGIAPVFGAVFRYESPIGKSIDIELRYRKGGWQEGDAYERSMSILEMPVTGHISFGKGKLKGFVTLGETITYIVSQSEELKNPAYNPIFNNKPTNSKWGFALNGGLGMLRTLGKSVIQFEARGTFQVTNLFNPNDEEIALIGLETSLPFFIEGSIKYLIRVK